MKRKLAEINLDQKGKVAVPDSLHFVWIGDLKQACTDYIHIWKKTNTDKQIFLWLDTNTSLCHAFHKSIHEYVLINDYENRISLEKNIKNQAFDYIYPKLKSGLGFDDLAKEFLEIKGIPCLLNSASSLRSTLQSSDFIIRDVMELFTPEFDDFYKYYCYEIILRGNLASASDIIRLLVIYMQGGIYIDMDTLPYTDKAFARVNQYIQENEIVEDDLILICKTEAILNKLNSVDPILFENVSYNTHLQNSPSALHQKIKILIEADIADFSLHMLPSLGKICVHKNMLLLGSLKRLKGIYFNNVIASHAGSKAIRIILRTMRKRYAFLEKNNCIFELSTESTQGKYLSRILSWRSESITKRFCVTPVLTGPGLIIEVMLGLAYSIFEMEPLTTPSFIAEYMQDEKLGIAFYHHNIDTPEGVTSTWRK